MLTHYCLTALRTLRKQPWYALLNILGLALGLACCLMILLYVQDELSYDQFHSQSDRIYRLNEYIEDGEVGERSASAPFPVARALATDYPEQIVEAVRFFNYQAPTLTLARIDQPDRMYNEAAVFFVDSGLFRVFDYSLQQGDAQRALREPNQILLTPAMANKYFPEGQALGQTLRFQGQVDLQVAGIIAAPPAQTHLQFDALISFATLGSLYQQESFIPFNNWYWNPCWTYLLLAEGVDPAHLEAMLPTFVDKYFYESIKDDITLHLQPLTDIHLHSQLDYEIAPNSRAESIYILAGIALFILLIAAINYMNLATARSVKRAQEVGLRKTLGVPRSQLVGQFLVESSLYALLALSLGIVMVELCLPAFNQLADKAISGGFWYQPQMLPWLLLLQVTIGIGAGLYPAFVLTRYRPTEVLRGHHLRPGGFSLRKTLVVLQFVIAMVLIVGTLVSIQQLQYLRSKDPGFQREHIVMLPVQRTPLGQNYEQFRHELLRQPGIEAVTALEEVLGAKYQAANYLFEGMPDRKSKLFSHLNVRYDFTETFGIEVVAGRSFDRSYQTDDSLALVINESMVRHLGWSSNEAAVGKAFGFEGRGKVVGVVKDFNFANKRQPIAPLVLDLNVAPSAFNLFLKYVAVRLDPTQVEPALAALKASWQAQVPDKAFQYFFLDQNLAQLYVAEERLSTVSTAFSFLAILVATLGLLGLVSFAAEQRRQEISVRKVLGASSAQIVRMLSWEFVRLVLLAFGLAMPLAWWLTTTWLDHFAFRITLQPIYFLLAGSGVLLLTLLTVGIQALKAAQANPADALRDE
jgi:putative ABC transport system permease protein